MRTEEIINKIIAKGQFLYHPGLWNNETDLALKELLDLGIIQQLSDTCPDEMNSEYTYIKKGE